jgi:hypothetical protein
MSVYKKLQDVRVELQKTPLKKSGKNKHIGFEYFELGDFLPTVQELFLKHKLSSNFSIVQDEARLLVIDIEDNSQALFTTPTAAATLVKATPVQELGAMHTYVRRYLYVNALEIIENDIVDPAMGDKKDATPEPMITGDQLVKISTLATTERLEKMLAYYKVSKLEELTLKQASDAIKTLNKK